MPVDGVSGVFCSFMLGTRRRGHVGLQNSKAQGILSRLRLSGLRLSRLRLRLEQPVGSRLPKDLVVGLGGIQMSWISGLSRHVFRKGAADL